MRQVRGSPQFWSLKKKELLATVRQLGCPTFFFTLSAAETKWPELLRILVNIMENREPSDEELEEMSFLEKAGLIQKDPVTCSRYFDYRFRCLFNTVIKNKFGPLGEVVDHFFRIEFLVLQRS